MVLMVIIVMVYGIDKDVTKLNHTYVVAVFNKLKELGASEVNKVDINFNLALQLLDFLQKKAQLSNIFPTNPLFPTDSLNNNKLLYWLKSGILDG